MKKIKVLYTITDLGKGGAERFLSDLITELDNYSEIEYKVAVCNNIIEYDEFRNHPKIVFLDYQTFSLKGKNSNSRYSELLDSFQPDIVHSNRFLGEFITAYDVRKSIKYVCHGHDNMTQMYPLGIKNLFNKQKVLQYLEYRYLIKKKYKKVPTYFIANSNHTLEFYRRVLPQQQKSNVCLINCGFNYSKFSFNREVFLPEKKLKLLNIGSYQPKKNQIFAVEIAEELRKRNIDFELNLIGFGTEYENVAKKMKEKRLEDYVFQRGLQSNVDDWCRKSDIYLHTAYYEPFGLVFLEAMASGLPVITLDGKGNRDIIENEKNGYLIENQDVQKFADSIVELLSNKEKYIEMSKYAQVYAKKFDVKIKTKELVEFYQSILD